MWGKSKSEGYIYIDQDCCRLLKLAKDGKTWASLSVVNYSGNIQENLINSIKQFFRQGARINVVMPDKSRTVFMNFPLTLDSQGIIKNLDLNKKDYFYTTEELVYAIKRYKNAVNKEQSTVAISYCSKELINGIKSLFRASGVKVGRVTTASDCLIGTLHRQFPTIKNDTVNLIMQVGYSSIIFMITQGFTPIRVESLFTGNLYDLESRITNTFGIEPVEALKAIQKPSESTYEGVANIIRTDRMELITRFGALISELRGTNLLTQESKIYVSYPTISEPELTHSIAERFGFDVLQLTGLNENEPISSIDTLNYAWLVGTDYDGIPDIYAESEERASKWDKATKIRFAVTLICTILPFIMMRYELNGVNTKIKEIELKYNDMMQLKDDMQKTKKKRQSQIVKISHLTKDMEYRGEFVKAIRFILDKMPQECRLEKMSFNKQKFEMSLSGYTTNRETTLQYLDVLSSLKNFKKIQIFYEETKNKNIKFQMIIPLSYYKN